jgi:hypothetical protein
MGKAGAAMTRNVLQAVSEMATATGRSAGEALQGGFVE